MNIREPGLRRLGIILAALVAGALVGGAVVYVTVTGFTPTLHYLIFQQIPCHGRFDNISGFSYFNPWSVTINGVTEVQPPNTRLPLNGSGRTTTDNNTSIIIFSLADGTYRFVLGEGAQLAPLIHAYDDGIVMVNGSNVLVQLAYEPPDC